MGGIPLVALLGEQMLAMLEQLTATSNLDAPEMRGCAGGSLSWQSWP